jgi:GTP diphosphokinase / guanosine-3',5'-bis(diphosphate) 3'-diphosphatase
LELETIVNEKIQNEFKALMDKCPKNMILNDLPVIEKAFNFACRNLGNTTWENDELILIHSISVAQIAVLELGLSTDSLVSALLHNVYGRGNVTFSADEVKKLFGPSVLKFSMGLSR